LQLSDLFFTKHTTRFHFHHLYQLHSSFIWIEVIHLHEGLIVAIPWQELAIVTKRQGVSRRDQIRFPELVGQIDNIEEGLEGGSFLCTTLLSLGTAPSHGFRLDLNKAGTEYH
jgi:hypothetical protein